MNINEEFEQLERLTGIPVFPDEADTEEDTYIVLTYAAEHPELSGDDSVYADTAVLYVSLYTDMAVDHMQWKEYIRDYLEELDMCVVTDIRTMVEDFKTNANSVKQKRRTIFTIEITRWR